MTTVTVLFEPSKSSQTELMEQLDAAILGLKKLGFVSKAQVAPVFPGDETGKYKGAFTVSFLGEVGHVEAALNSLDDVGDCYVAPHRGVLSY